jgi:hypothetical protein
MRASLSALCAKDRKSRSIEKREEMERKETVNLAKCLSDLILIDQKLAYSKFVFGEWREPNKWDLLLQKHNTRAATPITLQ